MDMREMERRECRREKEGRGEIKWRRERMKRRENVERRQKGGGDKYEEDREKREER